MSISFSAAAKAEVCRLVPSKHCCALAECFGILLFCNSFDNDCVRIITESREFAYILPRLFERAFGIDFDSFPSLEAPGKLVFQIYDAEKIDAIISECAVGWKLDRISGVSLAIMRLSIYEMVFATDVPVNVSLNEAIELAKKFDEDSAPSFINGILNKVAKEFVNKDENA